MSELIAQDYAGLVCLGSLGLLLIAMVLLAMRMIANIMRPKQERYRAIEIDLDEYDKWRKSRGR